MSKQTTGGFVLALSIAFATYLVMTSQGAEVPLAVAIAFGMLRVIGGGRARAVKKGRSSR